MYFVRVCVYKKLSQQCHSIPITHTGKAEVVRDYEPKNDEEIGLKVFPHSCRSRAHSGRMFRGVTTMHYEIDRLQCKDW